MISEVIRKKLYTWRASLVAQMVKNLPSIQAMQEMHVRSLGLIPGHWKMP